MSARSAYARKKATTNEKSRMRGRQPSITDLHQEYAASMGQSMPQGVPLGMPNGMPQAVPQGMASGVPMGMPMGMGIGPGAQIGPGGHMGSGGHVGMGPVAHMGMGMPGVPQGLPHDYGAGPHAPPVGTGVPTMNGRFLKFSSTTSPTTGPSISDQQTAYSGYGSISGRGTSTVPTSRGSGSGSALMPVDEFGMVRTNTMPYQQQQSQPQRKPTLKTEDMSGIEKSGLRSLMDKRSDEVRRGLAKKFTFSKKSKDPKADGDHVSDKDYPPSSGSQHHGRASSFVQSPAADPMQLHRSQSQSQFTTASMPISLPHSHQSQSQHPPMPSYQPQYASIQNGHHNSMGVQSHHHNQMHPPKHQDSWDGYPSSPPSGQLPPTSQFQMPHVKRWIGAGRPVQRWNKLRKDPELWDPNGDVLVYLAHRDQHPRPPASFRLSSHIIEATESRPLITLLREGSTEEDLNCMPPQGAGAGPFGMVAASGAPAQPTPPISEDSVYLGDADGQISYEMFFPVPPGLDKAQQLRHQLTTRNTFALLYHASLVGTSIFQALTDLHARLDMYISPESDILADMINYVCARGIDDIRSDPETAIGLLAWAESPEVRWEDGWIECFVHCVGMFPSLERCADFTAATPITRALLERAFLETRMRVQNVEERLAEFQFSDMWAAHMGAVASQGHEAALRLQRFFLSHYSRTYGQWPPPGGHLGPDASSEARNPPEDDVWLNRAVAQALQKDFAALYDYLVNRDIVWDVSEFRSGRKFILASQSGDRSFEADLADLPMTDMLVEFDNRHQLPHIPHPYPLVPESVAPMLKESPSMFRSGTRKSSAPSVSSAGSGTGNIERRVQLVYTEATNIYALGADFVHSDLIESFSRFEKSDQIGDVDPAVARRGRWILIYGILQTLASVSVDTPHMHFTDDVAYHLSPRLRGATIPPWRTGYEGMNEGGHGDSDGPAPLVWQDAAHEDSHCWVVSKTWKPSSHQPSRQQSTRLSPQLGQAYNPSMSGALSVRSTNSSHRIVEEQQQHQSQPQQYHHPHQQPSQQHYAQHHFQHHHSHLSPSAAHLAPLENTPHGDDFRGRSSSVASGATFGGAVAPSSPPPPMPPTTTVEIEYVIQQHRQREVASDAVSEVSTLAGARCYTPSVLSVHVSGSGSMGFDNGGYNGQHTGGPSYEDDYEDADIQRVRTMMGRM